VRRVNLQTGLIATAIGGAMPGEGGPATGAILSQAPWVASDRSGNIYIADSYRNRILKVDTSGTINTIAGNGHAASSGDGGRAIDAEVYAGNIAADPNGIIYFRDNEGIRKIDQAGKITRISASPGGDFGSFALDSSGQNLFFCNLPPDNLGPSETQVLKLNLATGAVTVVAGNGQQGPTNEGALAANSPFVGIHAIGVGPNNDLYIGDLDATWKVSAASGLVSKVAAGRLSPWSIVVDGGSNVYFTTFVDGRIRKVSSAGTVLTIAGSQPYNNGYSGEGGPATNATFDGPFGLAFDQAGNLYVADEFAHRVLKINAVGMPLPAGPPVITSGGVVPVGSSSAVIQPGEWVSIYGTNLASGTATWTGNFPISLAGSSVTIDGKAAYLAFVSPGQINVQAPNDAATGTVPVVVTTVSGSATSFVKLAQFGPSFLLLDSKHVAGIILRSSGSGAYGGGTYDIIGPTGTPLGYSTVAARAGDTVELFGTGLGPTNPAVLAGQAFSGVAPTTNPVTLQINNVSVTLTFAGLSGAGLYQLNLTIPPGLGTGDVSLQATVGGVQTPSGVVISLQ